MNRITNPLSTAVLGGLLLLGCLSVGTPPVEAQEGALYVVQDRVGIGTQSPQVALDLRGATGSTAIIVDENSTTPLLRNLITLENLGPSRIQFVDAGVQKQWRIGNYFGNTFRFDTPSGPGTEAELDQNGNLALRGTLSQGSSRTIKENFSRLDPATVLQQVAALPISRWNYRFDEDKRTHVGPTAEDFRAAFGLGESDTQLAPADAAGVALVAIQGLNDALQTDRAELERLRQENARLHQTVEVMAATQDELSRRLESLEAPARKE